VASWGVMCACYGAPWWVAMAVFGRSVLAFGGMGVGVGEGRFGGFKQGGPQVSRNGIRRVLKTLRGLLSWVTVSWGCLSLGASS
jgi:hypothetical protein